MLATFNYLDSGKPVKINVSLIISVEAAGAGLNISVKHPGSTKVYTVEGTMEKFDHMMIQSIYGDVLQEIQKLQTSRPGQSSKVDPDFLKKFGIDPDDDEGSGGPATIQ